MNEQYKRLSVVVAAVIAVISFFASWIYCIASYGFLFGLGLGWLPSLFVGAIAFGVGFIAWPLILFGVAALFIFVAHDLAAH